MKKNVNKKLLFLKNILKVTISNGITLLSNIFTGFMIPVIMGVTEYGYYKIFALYSAYMALCHFGFVDGILLRFAGKKYEDLDVEEMRSYTKFFVGFQTIISVIFITCACRFVEEQFVFICIMLGANLLIKNLTAYYQFISQATQRFTEMSVRNSLSAFFHVAVVIICYFYYKTTQSNVTHQMYLTLLTSFSFVLTVWYVITYRNITFGKSRALRSVKSNIAELFKTGIFLTIAYQVANLILVMDRQFVSIFYDINVYSEYSFAYNVITVFTTLIIATATVMFPMLRQVKVETAMKYYSTSLNIIAMISGFALAGYYPIEQIINVFMSDYVGSISYLQIIMPSLLPMSCVTVIMFTYYKVLNKNDVYFKCGCVVLVLGLILNTAAQMIFANPTAISIASIVTSLIWYLTAGHYFVHIYQMKWKKSFFFIVITILSFYVISGMELQWVIGMIIQGSVVLVLSVLFHRETLKEVVYKFLKRK